jgi:NitT/TauT family transport system substrate-binding protein
MRLRTTLAATFAAVIVIVAAACGDSDSSGDGEGGTAVKFAVNGFNLSDLPIQVADALGYYEEQGIEPEFVDLESGSDVLQGLVSGSVDVGSGAFATMLRGRMEDQDLKMIMGYRTAPGFALVVSPEYEDEISGVADLEGQQLGVSSPGGETNSWLDFLLKKNGVEPADVSLSAIGLEATAITAVEQGQVAAAVMLDPAITQLESRLGEIEILEDSRSPEGSAEAFGNPNYVGTGMYVASDWLAENEDAATGLATATRDALEYINQHTAEEIADALPEEIVGDDRGAYITSLDTGLDIYSEDGEVTMPAAQTVKEMLAISTPEAESLDLESAFTNEYAQ